MTDKLPNRVVPFLDANGSVSLEWLYWFQSINGPGRPIVPTTVGASPFSYTAVTNGSVVVSGGTVSSLVLQRGTVAISLGITSGIIPVTQGDIVIITYTVLPTVSFIPG